MSTADAVSREAAWLKTTGDSLPSLLKVNGGKWDLVQAYWTRTPATQKTSIFVTRVEFNEERVMNQRLRDTYGFHLKLVWPVKQTSVPIAEQEQQALDNAIEDLMARIRGPLGDKTHGGRFLSVGEVPHSPGPHVAFDDPERTIPAEKALKAAVTYFADDFEFND